MNRIAILACIVALGSAGHCLPAQANTLFVNSTADSGTACTLRNAIDNANNNAQTHSGCVTGSGADTITFDASVFSTPQTITVTSTLPKLTDSATTTIDGGNLVTVSGGDAVPVFVVGNPSSQGTGSAVFRDIEISHGNTTSYGGGLRMAGASLELDHVAFYRNTAGLGGSGLLVSSGTTTIDNSIFRLNSGDAGSIGGGVYFLGSNGADLTISNSTFYSNSGAAGGGLAASYGGTVTVTNSTFAANSASDGSAISNDEPSSPVTTITLDYVTIAGANVATDPTYPGSAIDVRTYSVVNISNSIVADNTGGECRINAFHGGFNDLGNNFFGDASCNGTANGNPMLGSLAYGAGLTPTMSPLDGSPLINAANCEVAVTTDQRGIERPQNGGCDIGAVEVEAFIFADGFEIINN